MEYRAMMRCVNGYLTHTKQRTWNYKQLFCDSYLLCVVSTCPMLWAVLTSPLQVFLCKCLFAGFIFPTPLLLLELQCFPIYSQTCWWNVRHSMVKCCSTSVSPLMWFYLVKKLWLGRIWGSFASIICSRAQSSKWSATSYQHSKSFTT